MPPPIDVSIVLPVFNEVGHLADEIERIRKGMDASELTYEIIVVDDGSTDGTAEAATRIEDIRYLRFAHNRGSGSARKAGTQIARGSVVVWTDADMTYPNHEIPLLVAALPGNDQVVGARKTEQGRHRAARVPAKWAIRRLAEYLTDARIPDLNSGFRAFRREVGAQFLHLLPPGFSCVTTLTMAFLNNGYSVAYLPIDYAPRAGESKFHWWRDSRRYLLQVLRMMLLYNPVRVFMPAAAVLGTIGIVKVAFDLVTKDLRLATNTIALLVAAAALGLVALLADLIVTLNRPKDLVLPAVAERIEPDLPPA
ncbi:MAG TPA: glycosyltransferase family 2 protein [Acidimicrobiia bacterium]|jgi:glycosyltransferase involved in cell wall biosynthesis